MHPIRRSLGTHQSAAFTATAGTIASSVGNGVSAVRVVVTGAAYIKIGSSPTATSADVYMPADDYEDFTINPGEKVSAVQATTSGGTLHVTELE